MESELQFICPRPRVARACDKCRSRKSRCLPDKKASGREACRRCNKLGYQCTFTAASQSTVQHPSLSAQRKRQSSARPQPPVNGNQLLDDDDDLVSGLFQDNPPVIKDEPDQIREIHHRVFQAHLAENDIRCRENAKLIHPAPASSESGNVKIGLQEADQFLSIFRSRKVYFPFVDVPEGASGASMAVHRPFLLLAILAVCSSQRPSLQRKTDEKFRRVLSEKVILNGEKSLDYVQGLLVYIAWCPIYLRPLNNQLFQYLQIAISMVADLKLSHQIHNLAAQNACLGCYNLSSLLAIGMQRVSNNAAESYCKSALSSDVMSHLQDETGAQFSRLQMLLDEIAHHDSNSETTVQIMQSLNMKLQHLESVSADAKIALHLFRLFIKLQIAFLPLKTQRSDPNNHSNSGLPPTPPTPDIDTTEFVTHCFTEIQAFMEYFLSVSLEEYIHFSTREWCLLIMTIGIASRICVPPSKSQERSPLQAQISAKMLVYLESLTHRMSVLSSSRIGSHPDFFYMLHSVLGILLPTYAPVNKTAQYEHHTSGDDGSAKTPSTIQQNNNSNEHGKALAAGAGAGASRCPIMNGSIQQTDFWQALSQGQSDDPFGENQQRMESTPEFGLGPVHADADGTLLGNDLLSDSQEWSRIFSEWVNDFGVVP